MLRFPTDYIGITQPYSKTHPGIDLGWKTDKYPPIYSADDGVVIFEGYYSNKEIACVIHHKALKIVTLYGHLSKTVVSKNDIVKQHQQIGVMGSTGNSVGNHLHFEVWANVPDNFIFSEATISANRKKYKVDPLSCTYMYEDQTLSTGNVYTIKRIVGYPVEKNKLVNQIEVLIDILQVRSTPNGLSVGYIKKGIYNYDKYEINGKYTWYQVEPNRWIAYDKSWAILYKGEDYQALLIENTLLKQENMQLKGQIDTMQTEINRLNTELKSFVKIDNVYEKL